MIYTTYTLLSEAEYLSERLETITGSRSTYGYDTPIPLNTVATGLGLETAATVIDYAASDPHEACADIAREWILANLAVWAAEYSGDSRVFDLMYFCSQYQEGLASTTPVRVDYCGNEIPGGGVDTLLAQINDLITSLELVRDGIDPNTFVGPLFEIYVDNSLDSSIINMYNNNIGLVGYDLTEITDNVRSRIDEAPDYIPGSVADKMDEDSLIHDTFGYDENNDHVFKRVLYRKPQSDGAVDPRKQAIIDFINAVLLAANLAKGNGYGTLAPIYILLRSTFDLYGIHKQQQMEPLMSKLRSIGASGNTLFGLDGGFEIPRTEIAEFEPYIQAIIDAENNARAESLRDLNFVNTYGDTDLSGNLTLAERIALENAVRGVMLDARVAKARELYDPLQTQFDAWGAYEPSSLMSIFALYVV
jgi:hypothetical protein